MSAYFYQMKTLHTFYNELKKNYPPFANALPSPTNLSNYQKLFSNISDFLDLLNTVYTWHLSRPNIKIPITRSVLFDNYKNNTTLATIMIKLSLIPPEYYVENYKPMLQLTRSLLGDSMVNANRNKMNAYTSIANIHKKPVEAESARSAVPSIASSETSRHRPSQNEGNTSRSGSFVSAIGNLPNNTMYTPRESMSEYNAKPRISINNSRGMRGINPEIARIQNVRGIQKVGNPYNSMFHASNRGFSGQITAKSRQFPNAELYDPRISTLLELFDDMVVDLTNRFEKPLKCKIPLPKVFGKPRSCASESDLQKMEECKKAVAETLRNAILHRNTIESPSEEIINQQSALLTLFPEVHNLVVSTKSSVRDFVELVNRLLNIIEVTESCMAFSRLENFKNNVGKRREGQIDHFFTLADQILGYSAPLHTGGKKRSARKITRKNRQLKRHKTLRS